MDARILVVDDEPEIADLVEDMKKLDAASLEHLAAIVKEMVGNK